MAIHCHNTGGLPVASLHDQPAEARAANLAETPVMRLFREWEAKFNWLDANDKLFSDEEIMPHYRENDAQGDRVVAARCETPTDFAAKMIVVTRNGLHDLSDTRAGLDLMAEARALIGGSA